MLLLDACAKLEELGDKGHLPTLMAYLAEAAYRQGEHVEAERTARVSEQTAPPDDLGSHVVWRSVRARVLARRGEVEEAERFAREAVTLAEESDFLNLRADALVALSEVLRLADSDDADRIAEQALKIYVEKGNAVSVGEIERDFQLRGA